MFGKNAQLVLAVLLIAGAILFLEMNAARPNVSSNANSLGQDQTGKNLPLSSNTSARFNPDLEKILSEKRASFPSAVELSDPTGFINADNFTLASLIGKKVILVDFWTYSCINCQRTFPYLNAWYQTYKDAGFVIVGVHTPEFEFEKDYQNVKRATEQFGIRYPVVLDSNYGTWTAYQNQYWPAHYLIDIDGFIQERHFGEGDYEVTESKIKELLDERAKRLNQVMPTPFVQMPTPSPVSVRVGSPETYFGASRNNYLANGIQGKPGIQNLSINQNLSLGLNQLYLEGSWSFDPEFAQNLASNTAIAYSYLAKGIYFVASADKPVVVEVKLDGKPVPTAMAGKDLQYQNGQSIVTVSSATLYRLVQDETGPGQHTLLLTVTQPGLRAYTFTFG